MVNLGECDLLKVVPFDLLAMVREVTYRDGWRVAVSLIESHWDAVITTDPAALLDAIKSLPGEALVETPSLLAGANYLQHLVAGNNPAFYRRVYSVETEGRGAAVSVRERLIAITTRTSDQRSAGRIAAAAESAREARRVLTAASEDDIAELRQALPHLVIQWARSLDVADHPDTRREYEDSYELAIVTGQANVARRAAGALAWLYADRGSTRTAAAWLRRAQAIGMVNPRYDITLHLAAALIAEYRLDVVSAEAALLQAESMETGEYWAAALWVGALHSRDPREALIAQHGIDRDLQRHPAALAGRGSNLRYLALARWRLSVLLGLPVPPPLDVNVESTVLAEVFAESAYRRGEFGEALRHASQDSGHEYPPRQRASLELIEAASRYRLGRSESGAEAFERGSDFIEHKKLYSLYTILHPADRGVLARASGRYPPAAVLALLADQTSVAPVLPQLTRREEQALVLLTSTRSSAEIAGELFISANTLKSLMRRLYAKLGVHSRAEAADVANRAGIDKQRS